MSPRPTRPAAVALALVLAVARHGLAGPGPAAPPVEAAPAAEISLDAAADGTRVKSSVSVSAPPEGYQAPETSTATKTDTPLLDVPQSVTIVTKPLIRDQRMTSMADVVRYVPGISVHQGENNRDQIIVQTLASETIGYSTDTSPRFKPST